LKRRRTAGILDGSCRRSSMTNELRRRGSDLSKALSQLRVLVGVFLLVVLYTCASAATCAALVNLGTQRVQAVALNPAFERSVAPPGTAARPLSLEGAAHLSIAGEGFVASAVPGPWTALRGSDLDREAAVVAGSTDSVAATAGPTHIRTLREAATTTPRLVLVHTYYVIAGNGHGTGPAGSTSGPAVLVHNAGGEGCPIHSRYPDGTPVYEGQQPGKIAGPNPAAGGSPHTQLKWDEANGRVYKARQYGEGGTPEFDYDFTTPTYPNGNLRPHQMAPEQHRWIPNDPGNPRAGFKRGPGEPLDMG
jgi:hypothetical protein